MQWRSCATSRGTRGGGNDGLTRHAAPGWADQARPTQVLHNLLGNALRHTPAGGQINLHWRALGENIRLEVVDTGEAVARIWPTSSTASTGSIGRDARLRGGAGLGLALVRAMVEAHGGQITAASAGIGHGSGFTITLPLNADGAWQ